MFERVAIVGVGLIGASIGLALKQRGICRRTLGFGRRQQVVESARALGAIDEAHVGLNQALGSAELIVICAPVDQIPDLATVAATLASADAVLTDAGSTKVSIVAQMDERLGPGHRFVGSHPLAGSERNGPDAGSADLFVGKTCVVTPNERTNAAALDITRRFWSSLGMTVVQLDPRRHDETLARTSHLPHLVSSALALTLGDSDRGFVGTGFRDTTRIAAGLPGLWTAIFLQNRQAILDSLDSYEEALSRFRDALSASDAGLIERLLTDGKRRRDALGS